MAAIATVEPALKSQPDVSKLNTFSGHTVTVTKHMASRNSTGALVVPTQQMLLKQALELQTSLPLAHGPGFYKFSITDTGGTGDDAWMVKLGPEMQEVPLMAGPTPFAPQLPNVPMGEDVKQIAPGYFYNEGLGILTTPWREVYEWRVGQPFPKPPTNAAASTPLAAVPPWATPQNWQQGSSWGGYPVDAGESSRVKQLEATIAEQNRQREMDRLREEMRRSTEETQKAFAQLVEKLAAKPTGPSEADQALRREVEETRRRMDEQTRETAKREDDRRRDEQHRAELAAMNDKFDRMMHEMSANKQDPMLPMLMQLITNTQVQAAETVKAIQSATNNTATAGERATQALVQQLSGSIMSPMQLMTLMQQSKGEGAEAARLMVESTRELMSMQKDVYGQLLDVAGQSGQPPWVALAQEAMNKIGAVGQALAERPPAPVQQQVMQQQPVRRMVQQAVPQRQAMAPVQRPVAPPKPRHLMTAEEIRAEAANGVPHFAHTPPAAVPMNGTATAPIATVMEIVTPEVIAPQIVTAPAAPVSPAARAPARRPRKPAKRRGGRRPARAAASAANDLAGVIKPPANPAGYTPAEMRDLPPAFVEQGMAALTDDTLFGELMSYVSQLRSMKLDAEQVAGFILQARASALQQGQDPPALQLILAEQIEVLVARLFPDEFATAERRAEIVQALRVAMSAEGGLPEDDAEDEDEDEETDDEEGDEEEIPAE